MRREGDNIILTAEEYDGMQEALRKRTKQMHGDLPPAPTPVITGGTGLLPPTTFYCPTCRSFRSTANKIGIGYIGDCQHRVWNLSELNYLSERQKMVQELGDLKQQYEVAILSVRQANDQLEDQRALRSQAEWRNRRIKELESEVELLKTVNTALQQEVRIYTNGPERASRNINL